MTPLEKVEALYEELVAWYGEGRDREVRAASKLLLMALLKLSERPGCDWEGLIAEHVRMLKEEPERFRRVLDANRGVSKMHPPRQDRDEELLA